MTRCVRGEQIPFSYNINTGIIVYHPTCLSLSKSDCLMLLNCQNIFKSDIDFIIITLVLLLFFFLFVLLILSFPFIVVFLDMPFLIIIMTIKILYPFLDLLLLCYLFWESLLLLLPLDSITKTSNCKKKNHVFSS